jgi:hypothetical protein
VSLSQKSHDIVTYIQTGKKDRSSVRAPDSGIFPSGAEGAETRHVVWSEHNCPRTAIPTSRCFRAVMAVMESALDGTQAGAHAVGRLYNSSGDKGPFDPTHEGADHAGAGRGGR